MHDTVNLHHRMPDLSSGETKALRQAVVREKKVGRNADLLRHGDLPKTAHLLLNGHTYRYRVLRDGRRQITAILVPGDICDLEAVMRGRADYSVGALTDCVLGEIPAERVAHPTLDDPKIMHALLRRLLRDEAISREWLVGMGCRSALERISHLLCELRVRLQAVGLASDTGFNMHFTQVELADVLGMSFVHVNRTLQDLRRSGLIELSDGTLTILDLPRLELLAGFDPSYLQAA